jgi:hypothetical protein
VDLDVGHKDNSIVSFTDAVTKHAVMFSPRALGSFFLGMLSLIYRIMRMVAVTMMRMKAVKVKTATVIVIVSGVSLATVIKVKMTPSITKSPKKSRLKNP